MKSKKERINGIKAIAEYLDTTDRNVYRWEEELGLPLHRVAGSKGRSVYAEVDELEDWISARNSRKKHPKEIRLINKWMLPLATVVLIIFAVLYFMPIKPEPKDKLNPITASVKDGYTRVKNVHGEILWSLRSNDKTTKGYPWEDYPCILIEDIDSDQLNEVIAREYVPKERKYYLKFLDYDNFILWRIGITNEFKFRGEVNLVSNFFPKQIEIAKDNDHTTKIITLWQHYGRFLTAITACNLDGKISNKYFHIGHLSGIHLWDYNNDGVDEIVFAGTNNLLNGEGILGVLSLHNFSGISPPYEVDPDHLIYKSRLNIYVPTNPVYGNQLFYIRFKKTEFLKEFQLQQFIFAEIDSADRGALNIRNYPYSHEKSSNGFGFLFTFNNEMKISTVVGNPPLLALYDTFLKNGDINIPLEELQGIFEKNVFQWDKEQWKQVPRKDERE
jgi:hypothetical protein